MIIKFPMPQSPSDLKSEFHFLSQLCRNQTIPRQAQAKYSPPLPVPLGGKIETKSSPVPIVYIAYMVWALLQTPRPLQPQRSILTPITYVSRVTSKQGWGRYFQKVSKDTDTIHTDLHIYWQTVLDLKYGSIADTFFPNPANITVGTPKTKSTQPSFQPSVSPCM